MKETFYLTGNTFPRMPVPHDNVISRINLDDQFITFFLDADVNDEDDAIRFYHPEAKSLIIRYHQTDPWYSLYKLKRSPRHLHKLFPPKYVLQEHDVLGGLAKGKRKLRYCFHYVGYNSIIIQLFSEEEYILDATVDYVEYEWME